MKEVEKNMHFHSKMAWPPSTYDLLSRNHRNWSSLDMPQNGREGKTNSYWKRQVLMINRLGKKTQKNLRGCGIQQPPAPPPPPPPLVCPSIKTLTI